MVVGGSDLRASSVTRQNDALSSIASLQKQKTIQIIMVLLIFGKIQKNTLTLHHRGIFILIAEIELCVTKLYFAINRYYFPGKIIVCQYTGIVNIFNMIHK